MTTLKLNVRLLLSFLSSFLVPKVSSYRSYKEIWELLPSLGTPAPLPAHSKLLSGLVRWEFIFVFLLGFTGKLGYLADAKNDAGFGLILAMSCASFYVLAVRYFDGQMTGHGIGMVTRTEDTIFGLSREVEKILGLVFLLIAIGFFLSVRLNFFRGQIYATGLFAALLFSLASWRLHYFYTTWYGSLKDAKKEFEDDENADQKIVTLSAKGYII